jgi:D-arabinose 1-dehydrogenase-like Zn-dependent alcohol dehydrogenase
MTPMKIARGKATDHQVNFEILYSGICHTDVHYAENDWGIT